MSAFLVENAGTLIVGIGVAALVIGIVVTLWRNRKNGKSSCGGGCSQCPHACGGCSGAHTHSSHHPDRSR